MSVLRPFRAVAFEYDSEDKASEPVASAAPVDRLDDIQRGNKRSAEAAAAAATTAQDEELEAAEPNGTKKKNKKEKRQKLKHDGAPSDRAAAAVAVAGPVAFAPLECPTCLEPYECDDEAERLPRALPCSHNCCSVCLLVLLKNTPGRVKCPVCRDECVLKVPAGCAAASLSDASSWLPLLPQSRDLIMMMRRTQALEQQFAQRGLTCARAGCTVSVTHWCADCSRDLCASHERSTHAASLASHRRMPIAEKEPFLREAARGIIAPVATQLRESAKANLDQQERVVAAALKACADLQRRALEQQSKVQYMQGALEELRTSVAIIFAADDEDALEYEETYLAASAAISAKPPVAAAAAASSSGSSSSAPVISLCSPLRPLTSVLSPQPVDAAVSAPSAPSVSLSPGAPLLQVPRPAGATGMLGPGGLSDELYMHLVRFMSGDGGAQVLATATLLYRSSLHGAQAKHFWRHCGGCAGPSLILVKVKRRGFVLGAFVNVPWASIKAADANRPAAASSLSSSGSISSEPQDSNVVADPSGRTFLFSLINAHRRPVKLKLVEPRYALSSDPIGFFDVSLMAAGTARASNLADSCRCFDCPELSYELDHEAEAEAGLPPIDFEYDKQLFAGASKFAAAEIEVYSL